VPGTLSAHAVASLLLVPLTVAAFALLGFTDDWSKASGRGGLRARAKLFSQIGLALAFSTVWILLTASQTFADIRFVFPDVGDAFAYGETGMMLLALVCAFVIVATSNAVNLTDGIDGLAAGLAVQVGLAFLLARSYIAPGEIGLISDTFWMALAGACLGFLFYNRFPARVFMGDTGSLAIGAALGIGAILSHAVFLLPFVGFIYFAEMFSVIAQVSYFKWTKRQTGEGKRLFRRAPLHHHFELGGWSEWRVVLMFWMVNFFMTSIGLLLWHIEVLPRWPRLP
jgi:phospho-N-acetylmuramoyl-pentapeptide-transferase